MAFRKSTGANTAHCDGYAWDLKNLLGKGSYGNVYKGWNSPRSVEVAVKVVRKDLFRQDPKAEQNLKREIDILKKLRQCEYVVHLYHVQDMQRSDAIVMVMELCEYDLDHLIKLKPFGDQDITVLLHQLGEGMKALRAHNIVHRDIKPGNILIKYHPKTGKMMIKLADFGFARHFTDESMKPLDLTSLAGTPVFMAPEALRCVFNPGVEHYDDKVDLWSIGALLYKVLVGQCGFYAQLNHILHILDKKGDAIAWEPSTAPNYGPVPKVKYIHELPSSLDERLSPPYKQKMNKLLVSLLKLDPLERMTYPEFFDFMDDLIKSKVEVLNLLHGTGFKFMVESSMKTEDLMNDVELATGTPTEHQVIFSSQSDCYISIDSKLAQNEFNLFMNRAGGSQGHAVLYMIPVNEVKADLLEPDYGAIAKLFYCVENKAKCVDLIIGHKYSDEIVHSISYLQKQIERQFSCIQEFRAFCTKQLELLHQSLGNTRQQAQETLGKAKMACEWLSSDVDVLNKGGTSFDPEVVKKFKSRVNDVKKQKTEIEGLVYDMEARLRGCEKDIVRAPSLEINDLVENAKSLSQRAKDLSRVERQFIYQTCEQLLQYCKGVIVSASERAHKMLKGLYEALSNVWLVANKLEKIKAQQASLDTLLEQSVPQWRTELLNSVKPQQITQPQAQHQPQGWSQLQQEIVAKNELIRRIETENLHLQQIVKSKDSKIDPTLTEKFKNFCISAKRFIDPSKGAIASSPNSKRKELYPALGREDSQEYLVVGDPMMSLDELIPEASLHLDKLHEKLLQATITGDDGSEDSVQIRITFFEKYQPGDIVLFHPVGTSGQGVHLNLVHLKKPKPYAILEPECYAEFGYRPGRIADLLIGVMSEKRPVEANFKNNPELANHLGEIRGSERKYYRVWAHPTKSRIDFQRRMRTASSGGKPVLPPPTPIPQDRKNDFV